MNPFSTRAKTVIDCHVHLWDLAAVPALLKLRERLGFSAMNLACIVNPQTGSGHASGLCAKLAGKETIYCFGGLNHAAAVSGGKVAAPSPAQQVDNILASGCDGMKLIESKPTSRQKLPHRLDGDYYRDFFARAEKLDVPLLWHVADPEEFWDPKLLPAWAAKSGWGYGPSDVPKEQLYEEVANVLTRHPKLRVAFAHFYFLSADLKRADRFLDAHPAVGFDLALGVELLFNLSRDPAAARDFFIRRQDRIYFGTDIFAAHEPPKAAARAGLIRRFLETDDLFAVPAGADDLLEPGGPPRIHGLSLPTEVLEKIYAGNFHRLAGDEPRSVNVTAAREECLRQATIAAAVSGQPASQTEAGRCAAAIGK